MKRILVAGDLHAGSLIGLTPEAWWIRDDSALPEHKRKLRKTQRACWEWYVNFLREAGEFDALLLTGDLIDGRGERSGSTELLTADREEQVRIAAYAIKRAVTPGRTVVRAVYGTKYHVSNGGEDFENWVIDNLRADGIDCKIGDHDWFKVDDVVIDMRHKVGGSSIPYGAGTPLARAKVWNTMWAARDEAPDAHVLLRGHVHKYYRVENSDWTAMSCPALQGYGSKYGARECEGTVDFGVVVLEVEGDRLRVYPHIARLPEFKVRVEELFPEGVDAD